MIHKEVIIVRKTALYALLLSVMFAVVALPVVNAADTCTPCTPCCRSPGFWKNHPEAWPVDSISIGGVTYTQTEAIALMDQPVRGDKTITLFKALVAAKLNVLLGCPCDPCIGQANTWLTTYPIGSGVRANSQAWQAPAPCGGEALYLCLEQLYD